MITLRKFSDSATASTHSSPMNISTSPKFPAVLKLLRLNYAKTYLIFYFFAKGRMIDYSRDNKHA